MKARKVLVMLLVTAMLLATPIVALHADSTPVVPNASFESATIDKNDIQCYKAERVQKSEADGNLGSDGDYCIKVGNFKPTDLADIAAWRYYAGRGSVGVTVRNLQPDTLYKVQIDYNKATQTSMSTGVLDIQGREDTVSGRVQREPWKYSNGNNGNSYPTLTQAQANIMGIGQTGKVVVSAPTNVGVGWKTNTHYIRTGPRTNEIYVFALTEWTGNELQAGVYYIDNIRVEKTELQPATPTSDTVRVAYQADTADKFPETVPPVQNFEAAAGDKFVLNTENQVISTDAFSTEKAKFLGDAMVSKGLTSAYTLKTITTLAEGEGIVMMKRPINFTLPTAQNYQDTKEDAYQIDISKNRAVIYSDYIEGLQNGSMTLLQAFVQRKALPAGSVKDYTDQVIRGLQVDSGRRYYTIQWLKDQMEIMAYYKQNTLQLRVKDVEGFRWNSAIVPNLVDRTGGNWSYEECQELAAYAAKLNIEIIPEVDYPGHSNMEAMALPQWKFDGVAEGQYNVFDITKDAVREHMISIYKEAAHFFNAKKVHMGGDEYFNSEWNTAIMNPALANWAVAQTGNPAATRYDALKLFFNQAAAALKADGIMPIVWTDNIQTVTGPVELSKDIVLDFWAVSGSVATQLAVDSGYKTMSSPASHYHDLWPQGSDGDGKIDRPEPRLGFKNWNRYLYPRWSYTVLDDRPITGANIVNSLGQMFPIWDDSNGYVPEYILSRTLFPRYAVMAYLGWGAEGTANGNSYSYNNGKNFEQFERLLFDLGMPLDGKREQVVVNYRKVDLLSVANTLKTALASKTSTNPTVSASIAKLAADVDKIIATPNDYLDSYGFATSVISDIIYRYENLDYVKANSKVLQDIVAEADRLLEAGALNGTVAAVVTEFNAALAEAKDLIANAEATQAQINASSSRLLAVIGMVDWKMGDKTVLQMAVDLASALDMAKYIDGANKTAFIAALADANAVLADGNVFQDDVDAAYDALMTAMLKLRLKVDKGALQNLINAQNAELARVLQAAVDASLAAKSVDTGKAPAAVSGTDVPQTGDTGSMGIGMFMLMLAAGAVLLRKKKED